MRMWPTEGTALYSSDSSLALEFKMLENFEENFYFLYEEKWNFSPPETLIPLPLCC